MGKPVLIAEQTDRQLPADEFIASEVINKHQDFASGDLYRGAMTQSFACKYFDAVTPNKPFEYMTGRCDFTLACHTVTKSDDKLRLAAMLTVAHHGASFFIDAIDPKGTMDERFYNKLGEIYRETEKYEPYMKGELIADIGLFYCLEGRGMNVQSEFGHYNATVTASKNLIRKKILFKSPLLVYNDINDIFKGDFMQLVILTAIGVGGATVFGALIGFIFKGLSHKFSDIILSFAAGVMLAAAVLGLIMPSLEYGGDWGLLITVAGIFCGAICLDLIDKLVPHMHKLMGADNNSSVVSLNKVLLFVTAIAIHNLPEGIAAGVSFGADNTEGALIIAGGIALQNVPEGMVIIAPMLAAGVKPRRTFIVAAFTGVIEVFGTLIGYFAVSIAKAILPFALAFAGGTMLYVISDEMIPETHSHGYQKGATYALLTGFCLMLAGDVLLG